MNYKYLIYILFLIPISGFTQQYELRGTVFEYANKRPLEAVTVMTSSGKWFITDSLGRYNVQINDGDSVWFSYVNKKTQKYLIDTIKNISAFDIALHVDIAWLPTVTVKNKSYILDSLRNRKDYANIFNYKKPGLAISKNPPSTYTPGSLTVGFDLEQLVNAFRVKKMKAMSDLQDRLLKQEEDKYIDHRFSKRFVKQLTKLDSTDLEDYMETYRPSGDFLRTINDIELGYYIQQSYKDFMERPRSRYQPLRF